MYSNSELELILSLINDKMEAIENVKGTLKDYSEFRTIIQEQNKLLQLQKETIKILESRSKAV